MRNARMRRVTTRCSRMRYKMMKLMMKRCTIARRVMIRCALAALTVFSVLNIAAASGASALECKRTQWPFASTYTKAEFVAHMNELPRQSVYEYFVYELTTPAKDVKLGRDLAKYLINTEASPDMKSFFELLSYSADLDKKTPRALDLNEVCAIHDRVGKLRTPSSEKKK